MMDLDDEYARKAASDYIEDIAHNWECFEEGIELSSEQETFTKDQAISLMLMYADKAKKELMEQQEEERIRRNNHSCTMGYEKCNERGECDGSC